MSFLSSDEVSVFPSARRAAADPSYQSSRGFSEQNIIQLVNRLFEYDSYVVEDDDSYIVFVVHGYIFKIDTSALSQGPVWAKITLRTLNNYTELVGQDENGEYKGLELVNELPGEHEQEFRGTNGNGMYYLKIRDDSGNVPKESYYRFTIDGGEIQ